MKRFFAACLLAVSSAALADTAIIEPSAYPAGTEVGDSYPGVSLAVAQGRMQVYDTTVYQSLYLTSDLETPIYTTGTRFAHLAGDLWNANDYAGCCGGDQVLRIDFRKAATSVAVNYHPDDTDTAVLQIYDRKGVLIAESYVRQSGTFTISLEAPKNRKIAYALATFADPGRIGAIAFTAPGKIK